MKESSIEAKTIKETWVKETNPNTDREAIKRDLVKDLTCPNYQFKNPFYHYGDTLGFSVQSELSIKDNYTSQDSNYQTTIEIKTYFAIPRQVPPKTQLIIPHKIIDFLEEKKFKKIS